MKSEQPPSSQQSAELDRRYREMLRERFFQQMVASTLIESVTDELYEAGFSSVNASEFIKALSELSEFDKRATFAYPAVLRPKLFEKYAEKIEQGAITAEEALAELRDKAKEAGFTIGFHLSQSDVQPEKGDWKIRGTEKDHRHDDLPMAYYSLDYTNRYLKKPARFLYIVRVETKDESGHYRDNDGTWGHAPSLAIVEQIDMLSLERALDERMRDLQQGEIKKEAA